MATIISHLNTKHVVLWVLMVILFSTFVTSSSLNDEDHVFDGEHVLDVNSPVTLSLSSIKAYMNIKPIARYIVGNYTVRVSDDGVVKDGYSLPATGINRTPLTSLGYLTIDLTKVNASLNTPSSAILTMTGLEVAMQSWLPTNFNWDPTSYKLFIYNEDTNSFEFPSKRTPVDYGYSFTFYQAYQRKITFGIFVYNQQQSVDVLSGASVYVYYPSSIFYPIDKGDSFDLYNVTYSFPNADYISNYNDIPRFSLSKVVGVSPNLIPMEFAVLGRFDFYTRGTLPITMSSSFVTVQFQTVSNMFYDYITFKKVEIDPTSIQCLFVRDGNLYSGVSKTLSNGVLTCGMSNGYYIEHSLYISAKLKSNSPIPDPNLNPMPEPVEINGILGRTYSVNYYSPVLFELSESKVNIKIKAERFCSLVGNFSLGVSTSVQKGYSLPSDYKSYTEMKLLKLDLTNVKSSNANKARLNVDLKSMIPTLFNLDPDSYIVMIYNEESNSFRTASINARTEFGYSLTLSNAFETVFTIGVFASRENLILKLGNLMVVPYPRSVVYSIDETELKNLTYSFPNADYTRPKFPTFKFPTFTLRSYKYIDKNQIPKSLSILGVYEFYKSNPVVLNLTSATLTVQFQSYLNVFYDINLKTEVTIDPKTMACLFISKDGNLVQFSNIVSDASLTCPLGGLNYETYQVYIVANRQPDKGKLDFEYSVDANSPITFSLSNIKVDIKVSPTNDSSTLTGNFSLSISNSVKEDYSLPSSGLIRSPLSPISFFKLDLTKTTATLMDDLRNQMTLTMSSWIPTYFNLDPSSYMILLYNETTNEFEIPFKNSQLDIGYSITIDQAYQKLIHFGLFAFYQEEQASFDRTVSVNYPKSVSYSINSAVKSLSYSFPSADYSTNKKFSVKTDKFPSRTMSDYLDQRPLALLGVYYYITKSNDLVDFYNSFVTVQYQNSSDLFYDFSREKRVEVDVSSIECLVLYFGTVYRPSRQTRENGVLKCYLKTAWTNGHQIYIVSTLKNTPTVVDGVLGKSYDTDFDRPVTFALSESKMKIRIAPTAKYSSLYGNFSLNLSQDVIANYFLPSSGLRRSPISLISLFKLDLSNTFADPVDPRRNQLTVQMNSMIPSLFNLDPTSYMILEYNKTTNSFKIPGKRSEQEIGYTFEYDFEDPNTPITFGVFAYYQTETEAFGLGVTVNYPKRISFSMDSDSDLKSISYSFPTAKYFTKKDAPIFSLTKEESDNYWDFSPSTAVLGKFTYFKWTGIAVETVSAELTVEYQTDSNLFYDISYKKKVEVLPNTIKLALILENVQYEIEPDMRNGVLSTILNDWDGNWGAGHTVYVVAQLKNPPIEVSGNLGTNYNVNFDRPVNYGLSDIKAEIKVSPIDKSGILAGNFSLSISSKVMNGYSLPISGLKVPKISPITFLDLDLTQTTATKVDPSRNSLSVKLITWIPTFINWDPSSFMILLYNEATNSFTIPTTSIVRDVDYGYYIVIENAYQKRVTMGVFAYKDIKKETLGQSVAINYPKDVKYLLGSAELMSISYSFPLAEYKPLDGASEMKLSKSSLSNNQIPQDFAILGRFDFNIIGDGWTANSLKVKVEYQTSSNSFHDISFKLVDVDPTTFSCYYEITGILTKPSFNQSNNGSLICDLDIKKPTNHFLYIVAKLKSNPKPPVPQPSIIPNPKPPVPQPSTNPTPVISTMKEIALVNSVPQKVLLKKSETTLFKYQLQPDSIVSFEYSLLLREASSTTLQFFIAQDYIPTPSHYDSMLSETVQKGSIKNSGKNPMNVYILAVNSGDTPQYFTFTGKTEQQQPNPNPLNSLQPTKKNDLSLVYILVPILVVVFVVVFVVVLSIIVYWIRRKRMRNIYETSGELVNEMSIQTNSSSYAKMKL